MKRRPVGISDFKKLIAGNCYFVDKTLMIKELIDSGGEITLITRPRRFGKTINMSMLKYFFEDISYVEDDNKGNLHLFDGFNISKQGSEYLDYAGKFPVIFLTFKNIKADSFENSYEKMKIAISSEFKRHNYLMESDKLESYEKETFLQILLKKANRAEYENSLSYLSEYLYKHHNKSVIILIDEYDTPIQNGYNNGFFEKITDFTKNFFGAGLKDNNNLYKGVLTGILRVAKESIFSDMNNLKVCTVLNKSYADKFGFTESEVEKILKDYHLDSKMDDVRDWYNGYRFGLDTTIYNPWSIVYYIDNYEEGFKPYWANSSDNRMIRELLNMNALTSKEQIGTLITGGSLEKAIQENIIYQDIEKDSDIVWSFLTHSGYLKVVDTRVVQSSDGTVINTYKLVIPNTELKMVYRSIIVNWFKQSLPNEDIIKMVNALLIGDIIVFEHYFSRLAIRIFSYHDMAKTHLEKELGKMETEENKEIENLENFYHGIVLGLLVYVSNEYYIESNKESGLGRCDISIIPKTQDKKGIILEFKRAKKDEDIESAAKRALDQIEEKRYDEGLRNRGINDIVCLGVGFKGKEVNVVY